MDGVWRIIECGTYKNGATTSEVTYPLTAYGFHHSKAHTVLHVCYAENVYYQYTVLNARKAIEEAFGSTQWRFTRRQPPTGFGVNVLPTDLRAAIIPFKPKKKYAKYSLGKRGELDMHDILEEQGYYVQKATHTEDLSGVDWVCMRNGKSSLFQIKARDRYYPRLYLQTHECNPDKRYT